MTITPPLRALALTALGLGALDASASAITAVNLSTPGGASANLNASQWAIATYSDVGGSNNDLGDGGFSGGQYLRTVGGSDTLTLTLTGLGAHSAINLGMHVAQLASIDPNRDGDLFRIYVDGSEVLQVGLGFGNVQSYSEPFVSNFELFGVAADTALVDAVRTASLSAAASANGIFPDHVYDFGALDALNNIAHTASTLTLSIVATAGQNWPNEAYALDNLSVTLNQVPVPGSALLLGLGLLVRAGRRRASS